VSPEVGTGSSVFMARVRAALARGGRSASEPGEQVTGADFAERVEGIRAEAVNRWEELLRQFTAELEAVGGMMHRAVPPAVPALVLRIAKERQLSRVVTWSESALGLPHLLGDLRATGLEVQDGSPSFDGPMTPEMVRGLRRQLDRAEIGLTGVDYAVADSGSLVLLSGPGKGRLVSCLPIVHVALLRPGLLVGSLDEVGVFLEATQQLTPPGNSPSGITFITGPSRTADIELSLTRGVHGPREVHVIAVS